MILIINTTVSDRLMVGLAKRRKIIDRQGLVVGRSQAEKLLFLVDRVLKKNKIKFKDLKGVIVVTGPGGFSSVRLGVILANTMGYALDIPVIGLRYSKKYSSLEELVADGIEILKDKSSFSMVHPFYNQKPNITTAKKK
ncbi:MAG: tRNA (adenosine(37)-N6)-threonylcarbamoyltransferase complex dimerization subunit type 1 TsaB [Patescibacteria group bacterium]|jgi:tRNA threonylcarbamoyl adenosine modification protein YeaZ